MKFYSVIIFLLLTLESCNLVKLNDKRAIRKLEKQNIKSAELQDNSLHIKYWKGGSGPTIVFIHGFGGDALVTWEKEMRHFAKTNTVVAYDLLWFGKSNSNEEANLSTQTAGLNKLLNSLKIESVTLVGQSYGGFIAMDFAYKFPSKIEKLVIANSPGPTFNITYLDTVCKKFELNSIDELFVLDNPSQIQRMMNAASYSNRHIPKFLRRQMFNEYFNKHDDELRLLISSLLAEPEKMRNLSVFQKLPALVLWGENDEIFPKSEGEKLALSIKAQFVSIPKCGHAPQIDQHKKFLKILDEFIFSESK